MTWLHLATVGDIAIAILAGAGLLLGVWFMARGSRAHARETYAPSAAQPAPTGVSAADPATPTGAPAQPTTFRHGTIRLARAPEPDPTKPERDPEPEVPPPFPQAPPTKPDRDPEPEAPPPFPQAPPTSFRQGRIRLGGIERGPPPRKPDEDPPDAA